MEQETEQPIEKQGASAISKPKNNNGLIIAIVIVLIILGVGGYFAQNFFANKTAEKIVEKITDTIRLTTWEPSSFQNY